MESHRGARKTPETQRSSLGPRQRILAEQIVTVNPRQCSVSTLEAMPEDLYLPFVPFVTLLVCLSSFVSLYMFFATLVDCFSKFLVLSGLTSLSFTALLFCCRRFGCRWCLIVVLLRCLAIQLEDHSDAVIFSRHVSVFTVWPC